MSMLKRDLPSLSEYKVLKCDYRADINIPATNEIVSFSLKLFWGYLQRFTEKLRTASVHISARPWITWTTTSARKSSPTWSRNAGPRTLWKDQIFTPWKLSSERLTSRFIPLSINNFIYALVFYFKFNFAQLPCVHISQTYKLKWKRKYFSALL